jgi:general secretion pathway protein D
MMISPVSVSSRRWTMRWRGVAAVLAVLLAVPMAPAQVADLLPENEDKMMRWSGKDMPLEQVIELYASLTGKSIIMSQGMTATVTVQGSNMLSMREILLAIESALAMQNVMLVPMGENFLRVVRLDKGAPRREGAPLLMELPEEPLADNDEIISLILNLNHVTIAEVQPLLEQMLRGYGQIQALERANSLLITDTSQNIRRIMDILSYIDRPLEIREDMMVRQIRHATAGEIAGKLNEFVAEQQSEEDRPRVVVERQVERPAPPGVIRPTRTERTTEVLPQSAAELAERGIIQGQVKIIADDRINTLFIITPPANFGFFERIIDILDRPVEPEIIVRVINLEYALAEEIAGILNEFIGAASSDETSVPGAEEGSDEPGTRAQALRDFAANLARQQTAQPQAEGGESGRIGRLSADTKILSDKRSNALLLMGRRSDIGVLDSLIAELDIMLGQVLIEAVIVEISLGDTVESGIDWLQRTLNVYNDTVAGPAGGVTFSDPVGMFGGSSNPGGLLTEDMRDNPGDGIAPLASGGLAYYFSFFDLSLDAVIRLAAQSRDARVLSTPVILTTDNTEATIVVGESRPVVTSTSSSSVGDRLVSNYQFRDIGINLTVTPRINPARFVVMDIKQTADNVGGFEEIDQNRVPIITKRELSAQIAVRDKATIVLGGLVNTDETANQTRVPLLGDIPLLGRLFRSDTRSETRTELLVLITPYVMMTSDEAREQTMRLHENSHSSETTWHEGWSGSEFATGIPPEPEEDASEPVTIAQPEPVEPAEVVDAAELEEGTYTREEMEALLEQLRDQGWEEESQVQDAPAGAINWQVDGEEAVSPAAEPVEAQPTPSAPVASEPVDAAPVMEEAEVVPVSDAASRMVPRAPAQRAVPARPVAEPAVEPERVAPSPAPMDPNAIMPFR